MLNQTGLDLATTNLAAPLAAPQLVRRARVIPQYLSGPYTWAYLDRRNVRWLDNDAVVNTILLGNGGRLRRAALEEIEPGQHVLQSGHVYGSLIPELADKVGPTGFLEVIDLAPVQAALARLKLRGHGHSRVWLADARDPGTDVYDVVSCFFLLHEIPDQHKGTVVDALLNQVGPGGKAVFVDYHGPESWNPLRLFYAWLFDNYEPYAKSMWDHDIRDYATRPGAFTWRKTTMFGGVFQKTVACRKD